MKIWMSGEIQSDIGESFRNARKLIEQAFNDHFVSEEYGSGLTEIAYLAIIRETDSPDLRK